jgi:hypothetical protein
MAFVHAMTLVSHGADETPSAGFCARPRDFLFVPNFIKPQNWGLHFR